MQAKSFAEVRKDVTAQSVHVTTALGNEKPKPTKAKLFRDVVPVKVLKADKSLGLVFGWAIVCKKDGHDYYDLNVDQAGDHEGQLVPEHVTEDAMLKASVGFAEGARAGNEMHEGDDVGQYPFVFPITEDIAKAMGLETKTTGLMVAYKPPPDVFAKFLDGTYRGFSIEGRRLAWENRE